jgi:hypothetical protein
MVSRSNERLFEDKEFLASEVLETYRNEEDKMAYSTMRLLYLFFQRGIEIDLDHNYLDLLSNNLEQVCSLIFTPEMIDLQRVPDRSITRLLHFARIPELAYLVASFKFYEALFLAFEEYEVCFNIQYLIRKTEDAISRKRLAKK